jgi:hypothetical protein
MGVMRSAYLVEIGFCFSGSDGLRAAFGSSGFASGASTSIGWTAVSPVRATSRPIRIAWHLLLRDQLTRHAVSEMRRHSGVAPAFRTDSNPAAGGIASELATEHECQAVAIGEVRGLW